MRSERRSTRQPSRERVDELLHEITAAATLLDERRRDVLALAVAGQACTELDDQQVERRLFELIQRETEGVDTIRALRSGLARLAEALR